MGALGGAASVIAVLSLAANLLFICSQSYQDVKDGKADMEKLRKEITAVQDLLKQAETTGMPQLCK